MHTCKSCQSKSECKTRGCEIKRIAKNRQEQEALNRKFKTMRSATVRKIVVKENENV